ncbi:NACHT domain-containing protein [Actinocrispum wychmicini]|uniref:NACHT domain-containing protein n=1 Tax=Actinocrispum wychmicini TaxID=1213861 RepID=A0A4R2JPZ6_9PSEU|nr:NACHT domain-containing protein [Actinocrispum wychmicini]TCO61077.1 NACHT domain-containing protein [Actinocrispum wychmicini]
MIDPIQITIGAFAGRVASRAINALLGPENPSLVDNVIENAYHSIEDEQGNTLAIVSDEQCSDIEAFLESKEVGSLIQSWAVLKVAGREYEDLEAPLQCIQEAFVDLATARCGGYENPWNTIAGDLWSLVTQFILAAVPMVKSHIDSEEMAAYFSRFSPGAHILQGGKRPAPRYIRDLVDLFGSVSRLSICRNAVSDIRNAAEDSYRELTLAHAHDEYRVDVDHLYVDRALKRHRSEEQYFQSDFLLSASKSIPRIVVIGDPGAGKSTLVQHTAHRLIESTESETVPILVQCRNYAANSWGVPLTSYIVDGLEVAESIQIEESTIIDALTVGSVYVIFDGVDEIIDLSRRRQFIRQIEAFSRRFPYAPMLATARRVGYARAKFDDQSFQVFELDEFSDEQVFEYVQRWFDITRRDTAEGDAFLRETASIFDIRRNPLMLSLLCTLYRARGYIPRNRRQVYRECSELLFQRWDAMRQIDQPFDHRQYGHRLMQELARFFYTSQSAQGGLEEQQLVQIIAIFFRDTASIDPPEDRVRAAQFVDFCADRAWLLSAKGYNSRGNRLFAFTHRTFMEFYAAECLVRLAQSVDEVTNAIIAAFDADPSSVVPDVMVQAIDDKYDRGAEQVLKKLLGSGRAFSGSHRDKYLSLCLRIVNSSPMSRSVSNSLPEKILGYWQVTYKSVDKSHESSVAFFELYRDPRARMIDAAHRSIEAVESTTSSSISSLDKLFATEVCKRWARFEALRVGSYFEIEWFEALSPVFDDIAIVYARRIVGDEQQLRKDNDSARRGLVRSDDEAIDSTLADYLISTGRIEKRHFNVRAGLYPRLYVPSFSIASPGSLIDTLYDALYSGASTVASHAIHATAWHMDHVAQHRMLLRDASAFNVVLDEAVNYWPQLSASEIADKLGDVTPLWEFLLWVMLVTYEAGEFKTRSVHQRLDGVVGFDNLKLVLHAYDRSSGVETGKIRPAHRTVIGNILSRFGSWATSWALEGASLTVEDNQPNV